MAKASIRSADGENLPLTDCLASGDFTAFLDALASALAGERAASGFAPDLLYVGATGGVREAVETGQITPEQVVAFRSALVRAFGGGVATHRVQFEVLSGEQEATWELEAAQIIWGGSSNSCFPSPSSAAADSEANQKSESESDAAGTSTPTPATTTTIGLFSGGGQSVQLGRPGFAPLSWPFSTMRDELEEKKGALADAWLDPDKWDRFEASLSSLVKRAAEQQPGLFAGCFVCTAMNHRAALYSEFAERPIRAAEAVAILRASLPQFRNGVGPLLDERTAYGDAHAKAELRRVGGAAAAAAAGSGGGAGYPLERITAMHTFRLCTILEQLSEADAQLFFAKCGEDAGGGKLECEWTLGAFVEEAAKAAQTAGCVGTGTQEPQGEGKEGGEDMG